MGWPNRIIGGWPSLSNSADNARNAFGYSNIEPVRRFGYSASIGTTEATVWDGVADSNASDIVNYMASASQLKFSSSSVNDTADGSGAREIRIFGLDAGGQILSEAHPANGQTGGTTTAIFSAGYRQIVGTHADGDAINDGFLYLYTGTATNGIPDDPAQIYSIISPGKNRTLQCNHKIPTNRVGFLEFFGGSSFGTTNAFATLRPILREPGGVWQTLDEQTVSRGGVKIPLGEVLMPGSEIEVRAKSSTGTIDVNAFMIINLYPVK